MALTKTDVALLVILPLIALIIIAIVVFIFFWFRSTNKPLPVPTPIIPVPGPKPTPTPTPNRLPELIAHDRTIVAKLDPYNVSDITQVNPDLIAALCKDGRIYIQRRGKKIYYTNNVDDPITRIVGFNNSLIGYTAASRQLWQLSAHSICEDQWRWKCINLSGMNHSTEIEWMTTTNMSMDGEGMYLYIMGGGHEYLYNWNMDLVRSGTIDPTMKKIYGLHVTTVANINMKTNTITDPNKKTQNGVKAAVINDENSVITGASDEAYLVDMRLINNRAYYLLLAPLKANNDLMDLAGCSGESTRTISTDACNGSGDTLVKKIKNH